jgi:hypothetical protein
MFSISELTKLLIALLLVISNTMASTLPVNAASPIQALIERLIGRREPRTIPGRREPRTIPGRRPTNLTDICVIFPNTSSSAKVWTRQPRFTWRGDAKYVVVKNRQERDPFFWQRSDQQPDVPPLMPGDYKLFVAADKAKSGSFEPFRIVSDLEYLKIAQELAELELGEKNRTLVRLSNEQHALQRISYFVEKGLLIDAVQTLFDIQNPSSQIRKQQEDLMQKVCSPSSSDSK